MLHNSKDLEVLKTILHALGFLFQVIMNGYFFYYFVISIFGWIKRKEKPAESFIPVHKFALLISAHNEEAVIGNLIRNLKDLDYPKELYDIYVVADNCSDNTAKVARENGAIVYERFDLKRRGKGYSLEWMFKNLFALNIKYDAVGIFDADNLVSKNFLREMNKQLHLGNKVVQGYLDSKNPNDTWISGNYSIAYWISNRLFQLPRHYLGLSCALGGTGFVMSVDVLKELGWGATCLTEDLEFSLKLVLKGMRVSWSHEAIIYDEKPLDLKQSLLQRKRWMQGHFNCAVRYFRKLMEKAFADKDLVAFDSAMYLLQPTVLVINFFAAISWLIGMLFTKNPVNAKPLSIAASFIAIAAITSINIIVLAVEGKLTKEILLYFILFPLYGLTWVPAIIQGFLERQSNEWIHTLHTRAIDISEIKTFRKVG